MLLLRRGQLEVLRPSLNRSPIAAELVREHRDQPAALSA
jgi:hypothetical protein